MSFTAERKENNYFGLMNKMDWIYFWSAMTVSVHFFE